MFASASAYLQGISRGWAGRADTTPEPPTAQSRAPMADSYTTVEPTRSTVRQTRLALEHVRQAVTEDQGFVGQSSVAICSFLGIVAGVAAGVLLAPAIGPGLSILVGVSIIVVATRTGELIKYYSTRSAMRCYGEQGRRLTRLIATLDARKSLTPAQTAMRREASYTLHQIRGQVDYSRACRDAGDMLPGFVLCLLLGITTIIILSAVAGDNPPTPIFWYGPPTPIFWCGPMGQERPPVPHRDGDDELMTTTDLY